MDKNVSDKMDQSNDPLKFTPLFYDNILGETKSRNSFISDIIKQMEDVKGGKLIPTNSQFKKLHIGFLNRNEPEPVTTFLNRARTKVHRLAATYLHEINDNSFDNSEIHRLADVFHSRLSTVKIILRDKEIKTHIIDTFPQDLKDLHEDIERKYSEFNKTKGSVFRDITNGDKVIDEVFELKIGIPSNYKRHYAAYKIALYEGNTKSWNAVYLAYGFITKTYRKLNNITARQEADSRKNVLRSKKNNKSSSPSRTNYDYQKIKKLKLDNNTQKQVAKLMGCSLSTVKRHWN